jgi:hypothetical protein
MNAKKRILSAMNGGRVDRIPAWLPVVPVTVSMMEIARAPWPLSHRDPDQMARLAAMPWELAGLPTATVPFCLSLEAEALGCHLDWGTLNRTPSVKGPAFTKPDEFGVPENLLERGRIMTALKAIEILQEHLGEKIVINAKVTGPFTIAGHIFGVGNFLSWIKTNPESVHEAKNRAMGGPGIPMLPQRKPPNKPAVADPNLSLLRFKFTFHKSSMENAIRAMPITTFRSLSLEKIRTCVPSGMPINPVTRKGQAWMTSPFTFQPSRARIIMSIRHS